MPGYDIIRVDDASPYFDFTGELERCSWFRAVFERKLWAYVADYVRVKTLFDYGGIYCDTDITAVKSFDPLLEHDFFAGFESPTLINLAMFGCTAHHPLLHDLYEFYQQEIWTTPIYSIPEITTSLLRERYGCILHDSRATPEIMTFDSVTVYPEKFFYPYRYGENYSEDCVTEDTYTIHWWSGSWTTPEALQWLNCKHLTGRHPSPESASVLDYLALTPKELRAEVLLFGRLIVLRGFKQGWCHVYEILGIPLLTIQWRGDRAVYFLFNRIKIASRKT